MILDPLITLLPLIALGAVLFFVFTSAQLIGFVVWSLGKAIEGLLALLGWILKGPGALLKTVLVLLALVFLGVFRLIALAALVLLVVLVIGIAKRRMEQRKPDFHRPRYRSPNREPAPEPEPVDERDSDLIRRLRADLSRLRRQMENIESMLGKD